MHFLCSLHCTLYYLETEISVFILTWALHINELKVISLKKIVLQERRWAVMEHFQTKYTVVYLAEQHVNQIFRIGIFAYLLEYSVFGLFL